MIVESPAKAHTIEKYLGKDFTVLASVGHIRKDTKVNKQTFEVTYEIDPDHKKIISELKRAAKAADKIWLATDEDREGESISWHLVEVLGLPKDTARITFHEITKPALEKAIQSPRTVDMDMVASQQARQTLDMLVGYDLSDIVRKKVPGAISAGRVQSPALRLIVEREKEIEKFEGRSNYRITGKFLKDADGNYEGEESGWDFDANYDGEAPWDETAAKKLLESFKNESFLVSEVEETEGSRANPTPFTTAALQIEANSKLGFSSKTTMSAAQGLYQAGLITYHRTDSLNLSSQAIEKMAEYIKETFGEQYLKSRHFKTKDASAQEAHEAIRPTDFTRTAAGRNDYEKKLYHLIWSRTLATQMANAKVAKTTIKIVSSAQASAVDSSDNRGAFIAKGEVVVFDGFLRIYGKSKDLELPKLKRGDILSCLELVARQNFAKPPARYTEAKIVKLMEEKGIGRPSTYSATIQTLLGTIGKDRPFGVSHESLQGKTGSVS